VYLLGLDVGTTGCKSIVFSPDGSILSSAYGEYRLYHRRPEWSELNPKEVWETVVATMRRSLKGEKVDPKLIRALSMTVLGEAFMPIDAEGNWLSWSMTTFDARAEEQTRWLEKNFGAQEIYQITGQPLTAAMPIYTLPKIMWIREKEPETYKKASKFLCWEDYINLRLCGKAVTDWTVATRTMMFDIKRKRWSPEILEATGIEESLLPEVCPSGVAVGEVNSQGSEETGLTEGTLVVTGGHDQPCGALGAGIVDTGPAMDATGTVECIGVLQDRLTLTNKMRLQGYAVHPYVTEDKYFMFGFNPSGGVILRWFRDHFAQKEKKEAKRLGVDVYDLLTQEAAKASPGSTELFLLPYFEGSGTPTFNRKARGAFLGLTLAHGKGEIIRAILEGLTYELRNNIEAVEEHGTSIRELRAIGGGAKSPFWLQLKADITKRRVAVPSVTEAAAFGAAILAGVGAKEYKSAEDAIKQVYKEKETYMPQEGLGKVYDKHFHLYKRLYSTLKDLFNEIEAVGKP